MAFTGITFGLVLCNNLKDAFWCAVRVNPKKNGDLLDIVILVDSIRTLIIIVKCVKLKYSLLVSLTYSIPTQDVCLLIVLFHAYHV